MERNGNRESSNAPWASFEFGPARNPRHYVVSKLQCWVALDRGLKIARNTGRAPNPDWAATCEEIREEILTRGWNPEIGSFSVSYDDGPKAFGLAIHELRGDRIARETIYYAEGFEPPEVRAQWRAMPPR